VAEWFYSVAEQLAHAFTRPPCRSVCGMVGWTRYLYRADPSDPRCADCEADVRVEELDKVAKRTASGL